eukprot:TRINITY_DN74119_c0_g1_i1.p1 TRINITY_DN74119_c0_g1~~TRINITY_DN74119_c0_g1_i1.p1  ORF type:complete len:690 (+),score=79.10 TRINITY_DN74119_c0_g1_i1:61-2130(+)
MTLSSTCVGAVCACCGAAALALAAFYPALSGSWEFIWDDTANFSDEMLRQMSWTIDNVKLWFTTTTLRVYEPVGLALKASAVQFLGASTPGSLHFVAAVSHALCVFGATLGTFTLLNLIDYSHETCKDRDDLAGSAILVGSLTRHRALASFAGAAVFAVHPVCVQAVCWVSCLPYLWAGPFAWGSACAYFVGVSCSRKSSIAIASTLSSVLFLSASFCKAAVLPLPVALALAGRILPCPRPRSVRRLTSIWLLDVPLWIAAIGSFYCAVWALRYTGGTAGDVEAPRVRLDMFDNILRASVAGLIYPTRFVWPHGNDTPMCPVRYEGLTSEDRALGIMALITHCVFFVCAAAALLPSREKSDGPSVAAECVKTAVFRVVACAWIAYLATVAPCLQLVQHGDPVWRADRYAYLPAALVLPPVAAALVRLTLRRMPPLLVAGVLLPLLLAAGNHSSELCKRWRSGVSLWGVAAVADPGWAEFPHQYGVALASSGRLAEAEASLQAAWRVRRDPLTSKAIGQVVGRANPKKGIKWFQRAIRDSRNSTPGLSSVQLASTFHDLAVLVGLLPSADASSVAELYLQALALDPSRSLTQENCGVSFAVAGRWQEAGEHLTTALKLGRDTPELRSGLGAWHFAQGRLTESEASFRAAVQMRPDFTDAKDNLEAVRAELAKSSPRGRPPPRPRGGGKGR